MRGAWGASASFFFSMVKVAASFLLLPTCAFAGSWRPSAGIEAAATAAGCSGRISQERIYPFHARASRKGVRPPRLPWFLHVSLHFRGCFGVRYPPPHFPVATCGLTPLLCVMFRLMGEYVAGGMPRFGREVKKLLAFVFLFMRIFRPGTTLAGVLDTSSPPQRFPACPVSLESTAPWWGRIWGGSW